MLLSNNLTLENKKKNVVNKVKELFDKGLLFEKQTEAATNAKNLIYIYIDLINNAKDDYELEVIQNLIKGQSEGFNFQRVPTIKTDTITVLEKSKYQPKDWDIDPSHHKVIICDNTEEKEHWEKVQAEIEKLKIEKPEGYSDKIKELKKTQFILAPDNLDVLHNLMCDKTIKDHGGIDVIYIDPPYNTGDINLGYRDVREQNEWLNFMKARLEVARDLLSDEGVIFCSIDDNMQAELKILFDEVFGKENFVATFIWRKKNTGGGSDKKTIEVETEYVLCYSKSINDDLFIGQDIDSESFSLSDKYEKERGKYKLTDLDHVCSSSSFQYQTSLDYEITAPDGNKFKNYRNILKPKSYRYTLGLPLFNWMNKNGFIEFKKNKEGYWRVYRKMYENVTVDRSNYSITPRKSGNSYNNLINDGKITTSAGKRELISIIDSKDFAFPKPAELISYLLRVVNSGNAIVLDFFAGSGTTASSIFELNRTQTIKRRFIVATKKYDFFQKDNEFWHNIAEDVMLERIFRTSLGKNKNGNKLSEKECPWLVKNKPYNEKFDVLTTKSYDVSLKSNYDPYEIINPFIYGFKEKDKKIINSSFEILLYHLAKNE